MLLDTPEAKLALDLAGAEPAQFLTELVRITENPLLRDLSRYLQGLGLSFAQVVDLVADVRMHEPEPDLDTRRRGETVVSPEARSAVVTLHSRGMAPGVIARVLELEQDRVERFLAQRGSSGHEHEVLRLHLAGRTPTEIADSVPLTSMGVRKVIQRAGETPHAKVKASDDLTRRRIVDLRKKGRSPGEIVEALGVPVTLVRSVIKHAGRNGLLPGYGAAA